MEINIYNSNPTILSILQDDFTPQSVWIPIVYESEAYLRLSVSLTSSHVPPLLSSLLLNIL